MDASAKGTIPAPAGYVHRSESDSSPPDVSRARSVEGLHARLRDAPGVAEAAIDALAVVGGEPSIPPLVALLGKGVHEEAVFRALTGIGGAGAVVAITRWLATGRRASWASGVIALGTSAFQLTDDEAARARAAARELFATEPEAEGRLDETMLAALNDTRSTDAALPLAAARTVAVLRLESLFPSVVLAGARPKLAADLLACAVRIGDDLAAAVLSALHVGDADARAFACDCASTLRLSALEPLVPRLLRDAAPVVRAAALRVVETSTSEANAKRAAELLFDDDAGVRATAESATTFVDPQHLIEALSGAGARDPHDEGLCAVLTALGRMRLGAGLTLVDASLAHPNPAVRRVALAQLTRSHDAKASATLARLFIAAQATDERVALIDAIGAHGDRRLTNGLVAAYAHAPPSERIALVRAVLALEREASVGCLTRWLRSSEADVRIAIVVALGTLAASSAELAIAASARDPDILVRRSAATVIARKPASPLATTTLRRLQADADPGVAMIVSTWDMAESASRPTPLIPMAATTR